MSKLTMLRGLPASGKSTKAKELGGNRVNRDLLREMLHYGVYSPKNERAVVEAEKAIVTSLLLDGLDVVVDDCNMNPKNEDMWSNVARSVGSTFRVLNIDTPLEECVERDSQREKSVGADVIRNMALQYGALQIEEDVVVCDIDGTIADISHRLHYVQGGTKDWKAFFDEMGKDKVREDVYKMLKVSEEAGKRIIFVSARPDNYRKLTMDWLNANVPLKSELTLLMRRAGDHRDDTLVKEEIYNKYLSKLKVDYVIDDRPKVLRMWQSLGLDTVDVGSGEEF